MGFSGAGMEEEYYGSRDVLEGVFGGANTIQKMMDVEAALALSLIHICSIDIYTLGPVI